MRRWKQITPSEHAWEREALDFVMRGLPDREPFRAWACFEVIDSAINEIDLLVVCPRGFFLVEIKSHRGTLRGDAGTWTFRFDGRDSTIDNPIQGTDLKAKRLKSLLERQGAAQRARLPFLAPLVFCSARDLRVQLDARARYGMLVRDDLAVEAAGGCEGIRGFFEGAPTREPLKVEVAARIERALEQAGIRESLRWRRVGDYRLRELVEDTPTWQEWSAFHTDLPDIERRVRIYLARERVGAGTNRALERAAERELRLLEGIDHPGIQRPRDFKQHDLGPALIFEQPPRAQRLDHYLQERGDRLTALERLHLLRQIAEILQWAHGRRLHHRALNPRAILVLDPRRESPALQITHWRAGERRPASSEHTPTTGVVVSPTVHPEHLLEPEALLYLAPELRAGVENPDPIALDIFSLGMVGIRLFAGRPPADSVADLRRLLAEEGEVHLSSLVDVAADDLDTVLAWATRAEVGDRLDTVTGFLHFLDDAEQQLARQGEGKVVEPESANQGDTLPGGFQVVRRLGQGGTAFVFEIAGGEIAGGDPRRVLKVARSRDKNSFLDDEAEVLSTLRHDRIVAFHEKVWVGDRRGLILSLAGEETLARELRVEGRPTPDSLERYGKDLLEVVRYLEEQGFAHRDIKPDNLAVRESGGAKHLVLFDFSLARVGRERIDVGTRPYLDPFLGQGSRRRWDLAAERFAAAMTLYEIATGTLPVWGDGKSDAALTRGEAKLHADGFDPGLRGPLSEFFARALARDADRRFDNADDMARAWSAACLAADRPAVADDAASTQPDPLDRATLETQIIELGLSTRALHALERLEVETVRDLLRLALHRLEGMRGVGRKTRDALLATVRALRARFPDLAAAEADAATDDSPAFGGSRLDRLLRVLLTPSQRRGSGVAHGAVRALLGLEDGAPADAAPLSPWPTQAEIARRFGVSRARIGQVVDRARRRWQDLEALAELADDIRSVLAEHGGVMGPGELEDALAATWCSEDDSAGASPRAALRAALEVEQIAETPRWLQRRADQRLILAQIALESAAESAAESDALAAAQAEAQAAAHWAARLGDEADRLAELAPLASPSDVVDALRKVSPRRFGARLGAARLVRLAGACSAGAAVSSRLELYPPGMPAERALLLASGVAQGSKPLAPDTLRGRVARRYPDAEPLPERPALDDLVRRVRINLEWDEAQGGYRVPELDDLLSTSGAPSASPAAPRPSTGDALGERLERAARQGDYQILLTSPAGLAPAAAALARRFEVSVRHFDHLFLAALRAEAQAREIHWETVLRADADAPGSVPGSRLRHLAQLALARVEADLSSTPGTVLLTHPGLLARYSPRFEFLERLRERLERPAQDMALRGLWVLGVGDASSAAPLFDGVAVPVQSRRDWAGIPDGWWSAPGEV